MDGSLLEKLEDMGAEVEDTLERLMGDEEMYLEYLEQFPDNQSIIDLRHSVDAGDSEQAMKDVHTLKGMALNLGLLPLVDVCMDMLLDFRAGDTDAAMSQIDAVEECFQEWAAAIRENQ
ncbi:MAG: Hpt domain-containing protein [Lachnospiraceae bacterium]|nr:Hpt domain-containing protein [Lachnospiraceae bacterium]